MVTLLAVFGFIVSMFLVSYVLNQTVFKNFPGCGGDCRQGRSPCNCRNQINEPTNN
jgi:hypothetical protein